MAEFTKFKTFSQEINDDGSFTPQECLFTKKFGNGSDEWPVEANRYRLLWMRAWPHSHKVVIVRKLLGLENVISLGTAGPFRTEKGWVQSYFLSPHLKALFGNTHNLLPKGPDLRGWQTAHSRARLSH